MCDKFREQIIKYKLDKNIAYQVLLSNSTDNEVLFDKLAGILFQNNSIIILENINFSDKYFLETGEKIKQLCAEFDSVLIIKNRTDITFLLDADGIVLDKDSIPSTKVHSIIGHNKLIGLYTEKESLSTDFFISKNQLIVPQLNKIIKLKELN